MKAIIVLVMHGAPPSDFPQCDMNELFGLQGRINHVTADVRAQLQRRLVELDAKMRTWPRSDQNDPFFAGSQKLASELRKATACEVEVAFNEFCAPSLADALNQAMAKKPDKIIVTTPMMTRGGEHSEVDIPAAVKAAQAQHPEIPIEYVWPFKEGAVANFLAEQIADFMR